MLIVRKINPVEAEKIILSRNHSESLCSEKTEDTQLSTTRTGMLGRNRFLVCRAACRG